MLGKVLSRVGSRFSSGRASAPWSFVLLYFCFSCIKINFDQILPSLLESFCFLSLGCSCFVIPIRIEFFYFRHPSFLSRRAGRGKDFRSMATHSDNSANFIRFFSRVFSPSLPSQFFPISGRLRPRLFTSGTESYSARNNVDQYKQT